jgi:hypothetical protein
VLDEMPKSQQLSRKSSFAAAPADPTYMGACTFDSATVILSPQVWRQLTKGKGLCQCSAANAYT